MVRRNNSIENQRLRCICGATIDVNADNSSAFILMNKKDKYLNQRLLLCPRCSYGLIEWINEKNYINRQAEIEEYKSSLEMSRIPPAIQSLLDQMNEVNSSWLNNTQDSVLESVLRGINDNGANNETTESQ